MNTMEFESIAAYQRAKGATVGGVSPTNEIKNILYPASVTSSTPNSATVVSKIKGYGTVIDSTNVIVREHMGDLGDVLLDNGGTKYWLKSMLTLSGNEMTALGGTYYNADTFPTGYTKIGILIDRKGKDALIMSLDDTSATWSSDTSTVIPNVTAAESIRRNSRHDSSGYYDTWIASGSMERAESYYGSTYNQYVWPFPRTAWDAMIAKVMANTDGSGSDSSNWSWAVTASSNGTGLGVATFTCKKAEGNVTFNPKDYDYKFDVWFKNEVEVRWPAPTLAAADMKGLENTKALVAWGASSASTKVPAAYWCSQKSINVTGYGAGNWWLPSCGELIKALRLHKILKRKGTHPYESAHWSSTQSSSASYAWYVNFTNSYVTNYGRGDSFRVRALSAYHFL